jgi:ATP-dependent protease ClpP protease subunit
MKIQSYLLLVIIPLLFLVLPAFADTFVNAETRETLHGYATGNKEAGLSEVVTVEKGLIKVNLKKYRVTRDRAGRNNTVALLEIPSDIMIGLETKAFEDAIKEAASKGPMFILIEIDSPGGKVGLVKRMCAAINDTTNCDVYAYVKGGVNGGAFSAAAAVALACDKIYMAPSTVIGAATVITVDEEGKVADVKEVLGENVGEKLSSGWRNYLASMAERNGRPGVLAKAMEDKDIEVIEVEQDGIRRFIDTVDKKPGQTKVKTWSKKGSLLTLTAEEAVGCGMADKVYDVRGDLLRDCNALSAEIVADESMAKARELNRRIENSLKRIESSIDLGIKQFNATKSRRQALRAIRGIISDLKFVLNLKKRFGDDVPVDEQRLQAFLNTVQAEYDAIKSGR